ncbi:hypothetical protein CNR22_23900 [Sphingobacteriaceae bacterium]|nr:hypothetical protein CNR22_23900 [Sphingobacteriaceae bacterium]
MECKSQRLPSPEELLGKQDNAKLKKPKFNPKAKYKSVSTIFETKDNRLEYMISNMATYCKDGPIYYSGFKNIYYNTDLAVIDTNKASSGLLITVKMSDNNLLVFMFHFLCDFNNKETGLVNVTYFNYKYGEVDRSTAKTFNIRRKRLYPKNNIYTEELICGKVSFILENSNNNKVKMIFSGKEIELEPQVL